jgi:hypothetical protein
VSTPTSQRRGRPVPPVSPELAAQLERAGQSQVDYENAKAEANAHRIREFAEVIALGGTFRQIEDAAKEAGATKLDHSTAHRLLRGASGL